MENHSYVMMIDDDQSVLGLIRRVLDVEGYTESSEAARTVMSRLDDSKPNLVIMDIETPEFDSPETMDAIGDQGETPIIMLTARYEITTLRNALSACTTRNSPRPLSNELTVGMISRMKKVVPHNIPAN